MLIGYDMHPLFIEKMKMTYFNGLIMQLYCYVVDIGTIYLKGVCEWSLTGARDHVILQQVHHSQALLKVTAHPTVLLWVSDRLLLVTACPTEIFLMYCLTILDCKPGGI